MPAAYTVHWSAGAFGYFPTYSLGAIMAVQLFDAAKRDMPQLEEDIACGRFAPLREWLRAKVHVVGSLHPTMDQLLVAATGEPLKPEVFLAFLKQKYGEIYKL